MRRSLALLLLALAATACTAQGPGSTTNCDVSGCTVTFQRGVAASASILGVDAKLVAVNGNLVTLEIAGQQVTVPAGEQGQAAEGLNVAVQEVTEQQVVVKIGTGLQPN
ncbi:hypothetical protein [Nocardia harenae]|uniref:hypothetical protein n=1 Tax=Nocardia harenae TaxID=358707 RepID=UPI00083385CE|nr:hypothetical protein [Nocardia harenae]